MTTESHTQSMLEHRLFEMQKESELLLHQVHQMQEELERCYILNQGLGNKQSINSSGRNVLNENWMPDELEDVLIENQRLQALVEFQQKMHKVEIHNSLNVKLGNILIQALNSPISLLSVPGKLGIIWWTSICKNPPKLLGGRGFSKVISAYHAGGFEAVEKLLSKVAISSVMQANAYTALARQLAKNECAKIAEAARRAYEIDPKPYRLKWLAFRLHDAGNVIEADILLDILPSDIQFSESELRQVNHLRNEARHLRQCAVHRHVSIDELRSRIEKQFSILSRKSEEHAKLADDRGRALEKLRELNEILEQEKSILVGRQELSLRLTNEQGARIKALKQANTQLEQEKLELIEQQDEKLRSIEELSAAIESLQQIKVQLEQEMVVRLDGQLEATRIVEEQRQMIKSLCDLKSQLELGLSELTARQEESERVAFEQRQLIESLMQEKAKLEIQRGALEALQNRCAAMVKEHNREVDALKQEYASLEADKSTLSEQCDKKAKQLAELGIEIEVLRQTNLQIQKEKSTTSLCYEEQARRAIGLGFEVDILQKFRATLESTNQLLLSEADEWKKKIAELEKQITHMTKAQSIFKAEYERKLKINIRECEELKTKIKKLNRPRGCLEDMIDDLEPFFYGRRLTYIDVGAYVGDVCFQIVNSKLKIREVHLFEPNPHSYSLLVERIPSQVNNIKIHHYCLALGQQEGSVKIGLALSMSKVVSNERVTTASQIDADIVDSTMTTLDSFVEATVEKHVDLLKVDVEGYEDKVLLGASRILQNQLVDVIVVEVGMNPEGGQQCYYRSIDDILLGFGYRLFRIYEQMFEWISDLPYLRRANFVYISRRFAENSPYRLTHELHEKDKIIEELKSRIAKEIVDG